MSAQAKKSNPPKPADNRWKRPPFKGTVWEVDLAPPSSSSAYIELEYKGITEGGAIHGQYWDGRVENWCKDKCYTFEAIFSDQNAFEVTCPTKDFFSLHDARKEASEIIRALGQLPTFTRSWLKTIAVNGDGPGARAGANLQRMSMTVNLNEAHLKYAYPLFLHESAHVALVYVEKHPAWKEAQELDLVFISKYAKENPDREDVAETFVPWLKVKRDPDSEQSLTIKNAIPSRLKVFDDLVGKTYSNQF